MCTICDSYECTSCNDLCDYCADVCDEVSEKETDEEDVCDEVSENTGQTTPPDGLKTN